MKYLLIAIFILLAPAVSADKMELIFPSGKTINLATCGSIEECVRTGIDTTFCNEEGQYRLRSTTLDSTTEKPIYFVNWDTQKFCRPECMPVRSGVRASPSFSADAGLCCGDDPTVISGVSDGGGGDVCPAGSTNIQGNLAVNGGGGAASAVEFKIEYYNGESKAGQDTITWQVMGKQFPDGTIATFHKATQGGIGPNGATDTGVRFTAPKTGKIARTYTPSAQSFDSIKIILSGAPSSVPQSSQLTRLSSRFSGGQATISFDMAATTSLEWGGIVSCCTAGHSATASNIAFSFPQQDCTTSQSATPGVSLVSDANTLAPFVITCTTGGQLCTPSHTFTMTTQSTLQLKYAPGTGHCSPLRLHVFIDGQKVATTGFIAPGSGSSVIYNGPVTSGTHTIALQGEGAVGGCNTGTLLGWGGTITTSSGVQNTTTAPQPTPTASTGPRVSGDCGLRAQNSLCVQSGQTVTQKTFQWVHQQNDIGKIFTDFCSDTEVTSTGQQFVSCGESKHPRFAGTTNAAQKQVLSLDGVNDFVSLGDLDLPQVFTITGFFKTANSSTTQKLLTKWGSEESERAYRLEILPSGELRATFGTAEGEVSVSSVSKIADDKWHQFAFVLSAGAELNSVSVFIDGFEERSVKLGSIQDTSADARVGSEILQPLTFKGNVDDLFIYSRTLSPSALRQQYNKWWQNLLPDTTGVQSGYIFDAGMGDVTGRKNGQAQNGAATVPFTISITSLASGLSTTPFSITNTTAPAEGYACFIDESEKAHIAECADGKSPRTISGIAKSTGGALTGVIGFPRDVEWYCASDSSWTLDLDNDREACNQAGFKFTGRQCCSEKDDRAEFYNDPFIGEVAGGACWNKTFVAFGKSPFNDLKIINFNGTFRACNVAQDSELRSITDKITGSRLFETTDQPCTILRNAKGTGQHVFCSASGKWLGDAKGNRSHLSTAPFETGNLSQSECCEPADCWNGKACVENQLKTASLETTQGFRCINGEWTTSSPKKNWDLSKKGFCEQESQCLVDPRGKFELNNQPLSFFNASSAGPQCIADGQSIEDFYCDNGNWTTRTKLLALTLLDLAKRTSPNDFALYCDEFNSTLNHIKYSASGKPITDYLASCTIGTRKAPCVNNFCVLRYGESTAFGTSLNEPLDSPRGLLKALNRSQTLCSSIVQTPEARVFARCGNDIVYYNPKTASLLVVQSSSPSPGPAEQFSEMLLNPFRTIRNFVFTALNTEATNFSFFDTTHLFQGVYASGNEGTSFFAFLEPDVFDESIGRQRDYIGAQYSGIGFDACQLVNDFPLNREFESPAVCTQTDNQFIIVAQRTQRGGLIDAWRDLTGKLRP